MVIVGNAIRCLMERLRGSPARGAAAGAITGVVYFAADLTGTFAAIGDLFVADLDSVLLLLVPCAV